MFVFHREVGGYNARVFLLSAFVSTVCMIFTFQRDNKSVTTSAREYGEFLDQHNLPSTVLKAK